MKDAEDSEVEISSFSEKLGLEEDTLISSVKGKSIIDLNFYMFG